MYLIICQGIFWNCNILPTDWKVSGLGQDWEIWEEGLRKELVVKDICGVEGQTSTMNGTQYITV